MNSEVFPPGRQYRQVLTPCSYSINELVRRPTAPGSQVELRVAHAFLPTVLGVYGLSTVHRSRQVVVFWGRDMRAMGRRRGCSDGGMRANSMLARTPSPP